MREGARVLLVLALSGCGPPDASTPEGLAARVQAEIRAENWGGLFDLLGADGRTYLDADLREILATAKDARETGLTLPELDRVPLKDAYVRVMKASMSNARFKERLHTRYGTSGLGSVEGTPTARQITLRAPEDRTETLFAARVDGLWRLTRFPWDWRR